MIRVIIIRNELIFLKRIDSVRTIMEYGRPLSICIRFKDNSVKIFTYDNEQELYKDFYRIAAALNGVYWEAEDVR